MRDVVFLVADATMQQTLQGFFGRKEFHRSVCCSAFEIDARLNHDVFVASGDNDSGLYARPDELLRPHHSTHRRAVIMLDADWDGSPGAADILSGVSTRVARVWRPEDMAVIVLEPEIEAWFWQPDNPHVATAMNYRGERHYREVLTSAGYWPDDHPKPPRPKEALEYMRRTYRTDFSPPSCAVPPSTSPSVAAATRRSEHCVTRCAVGFRRRADENRRRTRRRTRNGAENCRCPRA